MWHQHAIFSRYWQHYEALMCSANITAMEHAAYMDGANMQVLLLSCATHEFL